MTSQNNSRLRFIDAARSIAIILMLQGHFISHTFQDYRVMKNALSTTGTSGSIFFDLWCQLRGFTAPLFFSITGLVFAYLLTAHTEQPFWKQLRVQKGIKRGLMVMLWGYILQLSVKNIPLYMSGKINDRFFSFHVLHCIGLGIIVIILLYALQHYLLKIRLSIILFVSGLIMFSLTPVINSLGSNYFPKNAPQIIQNVIHGPGSIFPITPWLGYVLFGGTLGVIIREQSHRLKEKWFPLKLVLIGVVVTLSLRLSFYLMNYVFPTQYDFAASGWFFQRFLEIMVLLGILMYTERIINTKKSFFMQMGQNTLVIYVLHVMILYGAVIGIGLRTWIEKSLTFTESIIGAIIFILFFGLLTSVQTHIEKAIRYLPKKFLKRK